MPFYGRDVNQELSTCPQKSGIRKILGILALILFETVIVGIFFHFDRASCCGWYNLSVFDHDLD